MNILSSIFILSLVMFPVSTFLEGKMFYFSQNLDNTCCFALTLHILRALASAIHYFSCRMQKENQKRHGAPSLKYGMEGELIEADAKKVSLKERCDRNYMSFPTYLTNPTILPC